MNGCTPHFDFRHENIFEASRQYILEEVHAIAAYKHIAVTDDEANVFTDTVADQIELLTHLDIAQDKPVACHGAGMAINFALDQFIADKIEKLVAVASDAGTVQQTSNYTRLAIDALISNGPWPLIWPSLNKAITTDEATACIGPIFTTWRDDKVTTATYHRGFLLHRPSSEGPARHAVHPDGREEFEYWLAGVVHRDPAEGPAILHKASDGTTINTIYLRHGKMHREDGPASIIFGTDERPVAEYWYCNGEMHRDSGPAVIERDDAGTIIMEQYWQRGVCTAVTIDHTGGADV